MKQWKIGQIFTALVYAAGIVCVVVLSVGYFRHSTEIANPNAMLPMTEAERCVLLLLFGLPFLLAACVMMCIMFSKWSISRKIVVFFPIIVAASIVGYDIGSELMTPEELPPHFEVRVVLDTDCDVYALSGDYYLDGDVIGGQTCCEARNKPFQRGESIDMYIYPMDVPAGHDLTDLTVKLSLMLEFPDNGPSYEIENGSVTCTDWEDVVTLVVTGNEAEGFQAVRE